MTKIMTFASVVALASGAFGCAAPVSGDTEGVVDVGVNAAPLTITNCGDLSDTIENDIWPEVARVANDASNYVAVDPNRYFAQYWFGYPVSDHTLNTLRKIQKVANDRSSKILCDDGHPSCNGNHIARAQGDTIRLCPLFWEQGDLSEQANVMLHEISHFSGAPDDSPQSYDDAFDLARNDPDAAGRNAYNYGFYYSEFR